MASAQWQDNSLHLIGQIDFDNAGQIFSDGMRLLVSHTSDAIVIDLSKLEQGNTLVLAICVQWFRQYARSVKMQLVNVPEKMQGIIKASHLEQMLY